MINPVICSRLNLRLGVAGTFLSSLFLVSLSPAWMSQALANPREIAELPEDREVVFSRDVAPVLQKNCVACHNASSEEGGVNLESVAKMKASDVDDVLVPGDASKSRLFLLASHAEDPVMPPEDNDVSAAALNPIELALLRRWIDSGAAVDQAAGSPTPRQWQPLPNSLQTVFGSAITPDGRLAVVGFGNQIQVFGSKSSQPIDSLQRVLDGQSRPPHDDFVQDLRFDSDGSRIISTGHRNVKLWHLAPFESTTIPTIDPNDTLAIATSESGRHVATLSRRGELSVAEVGKNRWQWMKGFDLPAEIQSAASSAAPQRIRIAVGASGGRVAIAWDNTIRIVRIDGMEAETINTSDPTTSMIWLDQNTLVTGQTSGIVSRHRRENDTWSSKPWSVSDQPITFLCSAPGDDAPLVAVDAAGKIAQLDHSQDKFIELGKLPAPPASIALAANSKSLWVTTPSGAIGTFDLAGKKFAEVAQSDPQAAAAHAKNEWDSLVGEKLVAADEQAVKQAESNVDAEKKSLEKIAGDIAAKKTAITEKESQATAAKQAAEQADNKLAQAKADEAAATKMRTDLTAAVTQLDKQITELTEQLDAVKKQKADAEQKLAAVPDEKKLAETIKSLTEASQKAAKELETKDNELTSERGELKSAEETQARGKRRLEGLEAEVKRRQESLGKTKADQEAQKAQVAKSKADADQSQATDQPIALIADGSRFLTRSKPSGVWSLWSAAGDWLGELAQLPAGSQLLAAGDGCVVIQAADGQLHALQTSQHLWRHQQSIGSATGESPFADRVLSVDVDPSGQYLATGGGEPSRSGELMIWNTSDGSLVRRIESPHDDTVLCVRFSPDGKTLASGGADRMIKLWDVESGTLIKTLEGHTHHVSALAWNVNRNELASGSADETVKVWNIESGKATRTISGLKSEVTRLVYVGRDERIGITCGDGYFRVYRTDNGGRETNATVPGGYLYALDANRDGTQFIVGGAEGVATRVDKAGKHLQTLDAE
ncbi:Chromosome partition protein Smc [Stieleria maiorica]|uniref:Chromosome partition protein Smc n=1 Tax=Stieleria maiorica TaxID=2795974 RepID=A0A5B9MM48_9BACT|nr:c-type cytochrome domain-containing protein [Stieleria maiorica]QEG02429.1 Chromosome partition protein Smc [Stieleria maiorica]